MGTLKTRYQIEKEKKDKEAFDFYNKLIADGSMKTAARDKVMEKFNIGSQATFYALIERVGKRIAE